MSVETDPVIEQAIAIELMTRGRPVAIRGFHLPPDIVDLDDIERVTMVYPVAYAGDEKPYPHIRRPVNKFMRDLPA